MTEVPTGPELGDRLLMTGATVKETPLLVPPFTVRTTLPVVAPVGTGATTEVALQLVGVAVMPLNATVLDACVLPKVLPVIVTEVPTAPELGDKLLTTGAFVPVPERPVVCGLLLASSTTVKVPVRELVVVGVKVTERVQVPPAARDAPQLLVCAKSPEAVMDEMFRIIA